jgi:SAM-dependent methyltransferase
MAQSFFSKLSENLALFPLQLKVKVGNAWEFIRVIYNYYPNLNFLKIDLSLLLSYLFTNPFRISKRFLLAKGEEDVYKYGETPLTTLDLIARTCAISSSDVVFELGCGRGRTCFWLNQFIGCSVVGIDYVPLFIEKGEKVKNRFHVQGVSFLLEDLFQADLKGATVVYLYGTCFSNSEIARLITLFKQLPKGTKLITVSYSLLEHQPKASFHLLKEFSAPFTWGKADVYLHLKA